MQHRDQELAGQEYDDLIWDYASKRYDDSLTALDGMDQKADAFMKITALLIGIVGSAELFSREQFDWIGKAGLVVLLVSLFYSLIARLPGFVTDPPKTRDLIEAVHGRRRYAKNETKPRMAAQLFLAEEGTRAATEWKANKITLVCWLLVAGLAMVSISALFTAQSAGQHPSP